MKKFLELLKSPKKKHPLIKKWEEHLEIWSDDAINARVKRDVNLFLIENNMTKEYQNYNTK